MTRMVREVCLTKLSRYGVVTAVLWALVGVFGNRELRAQLPPPPPVFGIETTAAGAGSLCPAIPADNPYRDICLATERRQATKEGLQGFFKVTTEADAEAFWAQSAPQALTSAAVLADLRSFTTALEVITDVWGPLRVGLGMAFSTNKSDQSDETDAAAEETQEEATNRLLQGGGTANFSMRYPLIYEEMGNLTFLTAARVTGAFDTPTVDSLFSNDPGLAGTVSMNAALMYPRPKLGWEAGLDYQGAVVNDNYATRLAVSQTTGSILTLRLGLIVTKKTRMGVIVPLYKTTMFDAVKVRIYLQQLVSF